MSININVYNFINNIFTGLTNSIGLAWMSKLVKSTSSNSLNSTNSTDSIRRSGLEFTRSNSLNQYKLVPQSDHEDLIMSNMKEGLNLIELEQYKLEQIPLDQLVWKMFSKNLSGKFILNMGLNILLCSIMIPGLFKLSNDYLIGKSSTIYKGFVAVILAIGCEIISIVHKNCIIEPGKRKFITLVHSDLEEEVGKQILQINWNKLRELNKNELDRKKDGAKWRILGLINSLINTFIGLFSFFGYAGWVGYISPVSLAVYIGISLILIKYYPIKKEKNSDEYHELWDKYYNVQTGFYTDVIHLKGLDSLNQMKQCICDIETKRDNDKKSDSMFTDTIRLVWNLCFIINCLGLYWYTNMSVDDKIETNPSDIIIYIQYSCMMRSSVTMFFNIYTQYSEAKREYAKLEDIVSKSSKRIELEQDIKFETIRIESLEYIYPQDSNLSNKPFRLVLESNTVLSFKLSQIIRLDGNSGHGKSTFSDILNGIIPFTEYTGSIYLDSNSDSNSNSNSARKVPGFDTLTQSRYYNEQSESICWKPSVYEIVSGKTIHMDKLTGPVEVDKTDEELVLEALTICSCLDFLKRDNVTSDSKWIYTRNIGMSGGQKGRVALARSIYRVIKTCPKIVTLDEVDKAIQSELVVGIMKNIYRYARTNNILMFVICHNSDVAKLDEYDQIIRFDKGVISLN
jgi:ABC-type multidrug transport system fused ATPase/permease subunit